MSFSCFNTLIFLFWLQNLHESAKAEVDKIMRTEAPLLFPPGQVLYYLHSNSDVSFAFQCDLQIQYLNEESYVAPIKQFLVFLYQCLNVLVFYLVKLNV